MCHGNEIWSCWSAWSQIGNMRWKPARSHLNLTFRVHLRRLDYCSIKALWEATLMCHKICFVVCWPQEQQLLPEHQEHTQSCMMPLKMFPTSIYCITTCSKDLYAFFLTVKDNNVHSTETGARQSLSEKLQHHVLFCSEQELASWQTVHVDYLFIFTAAHHIYGENRVK